MATNFARYIEQTKKCTALERRVLEPNGQALCFDFNKWCSFRKCPHVQPKRKVPNDFRCSDSTAEGWILGEQKGGGSVGVEGTTEGQGV